MKFEYTLAELSTAITALEQVYGKVSVLDPYLGTVLDPATLQPTDKAEELTALDETGRGVQLAQADDGPELVLYQGIQADARPCVLAFHCCMPHNLQSSAGAENSFNRVLAQMQDELRRDYLTGVYNARYLDTEYRRYAEPQAQAGKPVGVVMARDPNSSVFGIVSFAWAGFGGSFGAVVLCSLFWKRCNWQGALAGMLSGGLMVFVWKYIISPLGGVFGIYELLPAFLVSLVVCVVVSLVTPAPSAEIEAEFDAAK